MVTDTGEPAITQEIFKCVSRSVAGVCLQDLANRANQISVSNWSWPIKILIVKLACAMEIFVKEILILNILAQDYHSDNDVSAIIDSDSDILETVEKELNVGRV